MPDHPTNPDPGGATDATDADEPEADKGVGESVQRRGEDITDDDGKERGRHDGAPDPVSGRPTGTSDPSDMTGI